MTDFDGKVAIVTGGASGIGEAIVRSLASDGARLIVADLDAVRASSLALELGSDSVRSFGVDVTDPEAVRRMVDFAVFTFGSLDLAVNNAGAGVPTVLLADISLDDWRRSIDVNLNSVFYCMKYQIPAMITAGGGSIVNMSSVLGAVAADGSSAYVAAKHGLVGMTKSAAIDYATRRIRVNAVGPGFIATPLLEQNMTADERAGLAETHPMKRIGQPEEIAGITSFLLSDAASFVTGAFYPADGGFLAQ